MADETATDMDVERIRNALAEWDSPTSMPGRGSREAAGDVLAEVVRLVLEADVVELCETHRSLQFELSSGCVKGWELFTRSQGETDPGCRMVPLVIPKDET